MDTLGAFLTVLNSNQRNRNLASPNFSDQFGWCQMRKIVSAYVTNWNDGLATILCHQQKCGVHIVKTVRGAPMRCFPLDAKEACPAVRVLSHYSGSIGSFEAPSRGGAGFGYDVACFGWFKAIRKAFCGRVRHEFRTAKRGTLKVSAQCLVCKKIIESENLDEHSRRVGMT